MKRLVGMISLSLMIVIFLSIKIFAIEERNFLEFGKIISQRNIKGIDGEDRFILYNLEAGGYIIYDNFSKEVCEYSLAEKSSPYHFLDKDELYYFGINAYAIKVDNLFYDLNTHKVIDFQNVDPLPIITAKEKVNYSSKNKASTKYEIPYARYFKLLDGVHSRFPVNNKNDCGYVAEAILLSYYANFYNSDIICEHFMNKTSINHNSILIDEWEEVNCCNQSFKDEILERGVSNYQTVPIDIEYNLQNYLNQQFDFVVQGVHKSYVITESGTKNIIRNGNPVIIFGRFDMVDSDTNTGNHVILAYGIEEDGFIIAHMGWTNRSEVRINYNFLNLGVAGGYVYWEYSLPHKHGGYTYVNDKCYCLSEEKYITPETSYTISFYDAIYHQIACICGKNGLEKHNYQLTISGKDKRQTCKNCGYWIPHIG